MTTPNRKPTLPAARAMLGALALAAAATFPAHAADPPKDVPPQVSEADREALKEDARPPQASIPFAQRSISNWVADGRKGVYIRAQQRWYYARVVQPCLGLDFATGIGFDTGPMSTFDRYSYLIVDGDRCVLDSVHRSGPPPSRAKPKPVAPAEGAPKPAPPADVPAEAPAEGKPVSSPPEAPPPA